MGSASNTVALQVGGALGVAVIGSVMLTRYQGHMAAVLAGRHVPSSVAQTIFGSLGAALAVAVRVGGSTGFGLARAVHRFHERQRRGTHCGRYRRRRRSRPRARGATLELSCYADTSRRAGSLSPE